MIYDILTLQNTHLSQFWPINCLRLNQHLMNLLYIARCITSCCEIRRTSAPCSGSFIHNCSIFSGSTGCKHLSKLNNCLTRFDLFCLLLFCRQLYMFRVLTPIIRSSHNCNYSFWYWLTGSTTRSCNYSCTSSWWWVSTHETCRAAYRNVINWISRILLDSYWIYLISVGLRWLHCLQHGCSSRLSLHFT
jgi:hypothetical protein